VIHWTSGERVMIACEKQVPHSFGMTGLFCLAWGADRVGSSSFSRFTNSCIHIGFEFSARDRADAGNAHRAFGAKNAPKDDKLSVQLLNWSFP